MCLFKPVCAIVGVGEGNGAALAPAFDGAGMAVALLARHEGFASALAQELSDARAYGCDVSDASSVAQAFAAIRTEMGDPAALICDSFVAYAAAPFGLDVRGRGQAIRRELVTCGCLYTDAA